MQLSRVVPRVGSSLPDRVVISRLCLLFRDRRYPRSRTVRFLLFMISRERRSPVAQTGLMRARLLSLIIRLVIPVCLSVIRTQQAAAFRSAAASRGYSRDSRRTTRISSQITLRRGIRTCSRTVSR